MGPPQGCVKPDEASDFIRGSEDGFFDEKALVIPDPDHSLTEERFVIMGMSRATKILIVAHC